MSVGEERARFRTELARALETRDELSKRIRTLTEQRDRAETDAEAAAQREARLCTIRLLRRQLRRARAEAQALRLLLAYAV